MGPVTDEFGVPAGPAMATSSIAIAGRALKLILGEGVTINGSYMEWAP